MRLKLFRAPDMAAAMAAVRSELGVDALILGSRRTRDGVEITAALEARDLDEPMPPPLAPREPALAAALRFHGVPDGVRDRLLQGSLPEALATGLRFAPLELRGGGAPLLLIGPPGAGKTLTVARLATRLVMAGVTPVVITADGRRAGAMEQLCAFTRILGIHLIAASHPVPLARALAERPGDTPVLIDTPGFDPFDPAQREEIAHLLAASGGEAVLVLPAGLDAAEAGELAVACAELGAVRMVGTRFDLARRLGGIVAAASSGLALAEAGVGPGAADGLTPLTPEFLAARLAHIPTSQPDARR